MRVLAIGATGFIGRRVVRRLVRAGHDVAVLHRTQAGANLPEGTREIQGDRDRLEDCRGEVDRWAAEVVLDLILYTRPQARELLEVLVGRVARLVALSSADVYRNYDGLRGRSGAPPDPVPLREGAPLRETRHPYRGTDTSFEYAYDYDKLLVEEALRTEPGLPATVLRLPAVYGPSDPQHRLAPYLRRMTTAHDRILLEEGQARWHWTRGFVENVAAAVALAVTAAPAAHRVYNVGDEPTLDERGWVERIAAAAGWTGDVVPVSAAELPAPLRPSLDWRYELWTDTTRLRRELGYVEPVPLEEALRTTVDAERSGPPR